MGNSRRQMRWLAVLTAFTEEQTVLGGRFLRFFTPLYTPAVLRMRKKINKRFLGVLQLYHTKDALCVQNI
jgi:hypothetical protein